MRYAHRALFIIGRRQVLHQHSSPHAIHHGDVHYRPIVDVDELFGAHELREESEVYVNALDASIQQLEA